MAVMTLRCGRCRYEFIVGGLAKAKTTCPRCGTRNRIPGETASAPEATASAPEPVPTSEASPSSDTTEPPPDGPRWVVCPQCAYRFAVGDVETVKCPLCSAEVAASG